LTSAFTPLWHIAIAQLFLETGGMALEAFVEFRHRVIREWKALGNDFRHQSNPFRDNPSFSLFAARLSSERSAAHGRSPANLQFQRETLTD
jgi:hypothetical protein